MASMEHPIFSLSTKPEQRPLIYEHNGKRVEVVPSGKGLATVFDKDILIYCISKLVSMRDDGKEIGPCVRLTTHDMLVATNRPTNSVGYERLEPALDRLMGTFVKTSILTGRRPETKAFSLIQSYDYSRKKHGIFERLAVPRSGAVELAVSRHRSQRGAGDQPRLFPAAAANRPAALRTGAQALRQAAKLARLIRRAAKKGGFVHGACAEVHRIHAPRRNREPSCPITP